MVVTAVIIVLLAGVCVYLLATRPCRSGYHRHRHWRWRDHYR